MLTNLNLGNMGNLRNYLRGESVAVVSQDTTSLTLTFINIIPTEYKLVK